MANQAEELSNPPSSIGPDQLVDEKTFDAVESIGVFDEEGNERPFGGLVRHGTVCAVFIRHFMCGYCQDYISALKKQFTPDKLADRKLIVIGCGHWSAIKAYRELLDCPFPIYSENTRKLYDGLGMICNFDVGDSKTQGKYITQGPLSSLFSSVASGFKMGPKAMVSSGKITQLGGEFIWIDGKSKLAHRMQTTRDHLEPPELEKELIVE